MEADATMYQGPVEGYTGRQSYEAGDTLTVHARSTAKHFRVEISRVGRQRNLVWTSQELVGEDHPTPEDAAAKGCRWPAALELEVPADWRAGYYEIDFVPLDGEEPQMSLPAFFVIRAAKGSDRPRILLVLSTNTYNAYNEWGGPSLYDGAVAVSFERPLPPGFITRPPGTNLRAATARGIFDPDLAIQAGLIKDLRVSHYCIAAGPFNWEKPFIAWAEEQGYELDYAVNADLETRPDVVDGRRLVLSIGHDEYWSWGMRDTLEAYIADGGNAAFFSGNAVAWQVRLEEDARSMVSYKWFGATQDPVVGTDEERRMTSCWSDRLIDRPSNHLTGVSFAYGGYMRFGYGAPRGSGGYTVWRPEHWLFEGTDLHYGDLLGAEDVVAGFEADGCELTMDETGLPIATHRDGTPETFEVLATSPAHLWSKSDWPGMADPRPDEPGDLEFAVDRVFENPSPTDFDRIAHGNAVMGVYTAGGTVFTSGCTDWTYGLLGADEKISRITRNVLDKLSV